MSRKGRYCTVYNARFERDDGAVFNFGREYGTLVDISPLSDMDVSIATSQGYQQVGVTVETRSIGGISRKVSGKIIGPANGTKQQMLQVFTPFASGKLVFNNRYYCNVVVKKTPAIGVQDRDTDYSMMLFCPHPYWLRSVETKYVLGGYTPAFSFPVNYAKPHYFGLKHPSAFTNCRNNGDVDTGFSLEFIPSADVSNYGITNVYTLEKLMLTNSITVDDIVRVYRKNGRLYVEKETPAGVEDIFYALDEESDFFTLRPGDNIVKVEGEGAENLVVTIRFSDAYAGVYDGM